MNQNIEALKIKRMSKNTESGVCEHILKIKNISENPVELCGMMPLEMELEGEEYYLQYFTSKWSKEFIPVKVPAKSITLEGRAGRCSAEIHPQFLIMDKHGYAAAVAIAWSGNWKFEIKTYAKGIKISAGINDDGFLNTLQPGEEIESLKVLSMTPQNKTIGEISRAFGIWHRECNGIRNSVSRSLPVEWNHWWSYEDYKINEETFIKNVDVANELGFEVCVLDAGWYGNTTLWYHVRGDWHNVNKEKFPSGIRYLSDYVHSKGMLFGLWCEIEALGEKAELADMRPEFMARRDGKPLNYVCFGNPEAAEWAYNTLERLITEYGLDWIKLDFNLDPWLGCNKTDHGHDSGNGLYMHYKGYFDVLDRIRAKYPEALLENCASGGLRIDHEILRHTYCTYLSDNDQTHNKMRFYSAALTFLPPEVCLHWSWSQSMTDDQGGGPFPLFNVMDEKYKKWELDFHMRGGMLGWLGFSHRIKDFDDNAKALFSKHIEFYKNTVKEFILNAVVYDLNEDGFAVSKPCYAFQYHLEDSDRSLIFVFNFDKGARNLKFKGLDNKTIYSVVNVDSDEVVQKTGAGLNNGFDLGELRACESVILKVDAVKV